MSRYADLDALEKELNERLAFLREHNRNYDQYTDGFDEAVDRVENFPAADVAPVVHANWVDGKCSNCGVDIPTDDAHDVIFGSECRFCYYCGAKMDGGDGNG